MTFWLPGFQSQQSSCLCPSDVNLHSSGKHWEIRAGVRTHYLIKLWFPFAAEVQTRFLFLSCCEVWQFHCPLLQVLVSPLLCSAPCSLPGCVTDTLTLQGLGKASWNSIHCTGSYLAAWDGTKLMLSLLSGAATQGEKNVQDKRETPGVCFLMKPYPSPDWIGEKAQKCNSSEILF